VHEAKGSKRSEVEGGDTNDAGSFRTFAFPGIFFVLPVLKNGEVGGRF
jgi:hypothetical protein